MKPSRAPARGARPRPPRRGDFHAPASQRFARGAGNPGGDRAGAGDVV